MKFVVPLNTSSLGSSFFLSSSYYSLLPSLFPLLGPASGLPSASFHLIFYSPLLRSLSSPSLFFHSLPLPWSSLVSSLLSAHSSLASFPSFPSSLFINPLPRSATRLLRRLRFPHSSRHLFYSTLLHFFPRSLSLLPR